MDKDSITDALLALANEMTNRSKIAQLREVFAHIEVAQRAGVKNAKIVETLNDQGFDLTVKSFEMMLHRIRVRHRAKHEISTEPPSSAGTSLRPQKGVNHPHLLNKQLTTTPSLRPTPASAEATKQTENQLTRPVGFEYKGTRDEKDIF